MSLKIVQVVALLACASLAGCASDGGVVKTVAKLPGFAADAPDPKDFVKETRPEDPQFIPVGTKITREARKMTPAEFKAIEADLDAQRLKNESAGAEAKAAGATPPPAPLKVPQ